MPAPLLPLTPRESAALAAATSRAVAAWRPRTDTATLPRVPEAVLTELVRLMRAEHGPGEGTRRAVVARRRVRWRAAATGALGPVGLVPTEVVGFVEQVRAAVDQADRLDEPRSDAQLAADVLVAWELLDDSAAAVEITTGRADRSLLDELVVRGGDLVRRQVPERWTPWATLRLLWRLRQLPGIRRRFTAAGLRSRGLRAIPVAGALPAAWGANREMKEFQRRLAIVHRDVADHGTPTVTR
ncbi:MAG: hypothetical protein M0P31_04050 [Solirubrobacteraceae bacterium]|nr:hypothetical protein [Solirubrobacteraceae bacterium]